MIVIAAYVAAFFFAVNIGASGTAASMGAAYGGGAVRRRRVALALVAFFAILGAGLGGSGVLGTISKGIVPPSILSLNVTVIVIASSCLTLYIANRAGIPLSTSEVSVGSLVGVGMAFGQVQYLHLAYIAATWVAIPLAAYAIAFAAGRATAGWRSSGRLRSPLLVRLLTALLILTGCYEAFAAGMNNVANAMGPLVGAGIIAPNLALWLGAAFMAVGALTLGGRALETNAKKITKLDLLQGSIVSFTGGSLIVGASLFGIPVPLTQASTMAIIGVGESRPAANLLRKPIVRRILKIWLLSPLISLLASLCLVHIFIFQHYFVLAGVCVFMILAGKVPGGTFPWRFQRLYVRQKTSRQG